MQLCGPRRFVATNTFRFYASRCALKRWDVAVVDRAAGVNDPGYNHPSGASSGDAVTTRVGTSLNAVPVVSSAAAAPVSWYSASWFTSQRS
jgi:hypothetical protein